MKNIIDRITAYLEADVFVRDGPDDLLRHARAKILELQAESSQMREESDLAQRLLDEHEEYWWPTHPARRA